MVVLTAQVRRLKTVELSLVTDVMRMTDGLHGVIVRMMSDVVLALEAECLNHSLQSVTMAESRQRRNRVTSDHVRLIVKAIGVRGAPAPKRVVRMVCSTVPMSKIRWQLMAATIAISHTWRNNHRRAIAYHAQCIVQVNGASGAAVTQHVALKLSGLASSTEQSTPRLVVMIAPGRMVTLRRTRTTVAKMNVRWTVRANGVVGALARNPAVPASKPVLTSKTQWLLTAVSTVTLSIWTRECRTVTLTFVQSIVRAPGTTGATAMQLVVLRPLLVISDKYKQL